MVSIDILNNDRAFDDCDFNISSIELYSDNKDVILSDQINKILNKLKGLERETLGGWLDWNYKGWVGDLFLFISRKEGWIFYWN